MQFFLEMAVQGIIEVFLSACRSGGLEKWNTYAGTMYTVWSGVPDVRWSQVRLVLFGRCDACQGVTR